MIEEILGMRVRINENFGERYSKGDTGTIIQVDGDDCPKVSIDGKQVRLSQPVN
jgi:hypothetical protein